MKRFTKKALPLAIAVAMTPGFASAAEVSGFADIFYTITDDSSAVENSTNPAEGKFTADGEVDFIASPADGVTVRVDVDLTLGLAGETTDSNGDTVALDGRGASIEQAFFAWGATEGVTILGGVFNNPIGYEAEDAPDMDFSSHGAVYTALDSQTALAGDNIAGLAAAFAVGPATITAALLNDLAQTDEKNSLALIVNYAPMEGLDLEVGMVTQESNRYTGTTAATSGSANALSVGNATNFNAVFTGVENLTVGVDYLMGSEVVDSAYDLWAGYSFGDFGVKVRQSAISYNSTEVGNIADKLGADATTALEEASLASSDQSSTTLYLSYQVASNLSAAFEYRKNTVDATDNSKEKTDDIITLELIATF